MATDRLEELKKAKKLILTDENVQMKMKGTKKEVKEKNVKFYEWKQVLKDNKDVYKSKQLCKL